jgi:hypothetical protein
MKMSEKRKYLFIALIFSVVFLIQIVSAASITEELNNLVDGTVGFLNPVSAKIFGDTPSGEWLFAKVLFFIIILSMVWLALYQIPFFKDNQIWVIWVVSIAVAILAVRFMGNEEWIRTVVLPYSAIGIAIAAGIPFVIYFILINIILSGPRFKTIRKVAWVFLGIIFIGLWVSRSDELGKAGYIYPATAFLCFIVATMDGSFQSFIHRMSMDRMIGNSKMEEAEILQEKLLDINRRYRRGVITNARYQTQVNDIRKRINNLQK